jgi:glycosyltransferase involved in cell wall biosynthesis
VKICMIVFNSATRDGRVMREAHSLRAAGHDVQIVGVPENDASAPLEVLPDGVVVHRVEWAAIARRRMRQTAWLRLIPHALILALFIQLLGGWAAALDYAPRLLALMREPVSAVAIVAGLCVVGTFAWLGRRFAYRLVRKVRGAVVAAVRRLVGRFSPPRKIRSWKRDGTNPGIGGEPFPVIRSKIPAWLPEYALESGMETFNWIGGRVGRFVLYRFRGEVIAEFAVKLSPDVVHCHDCIALPAGVRVKRELGIPLVYDAHEIYEGAAASRFGITDYYGRIHQRYLALVDGFVTINRCAAEYYKQAYPEVAPAVVVRNATNRVAPFTYDGRLHDALKLPRQTKILLYQGGFTVHRGLPTVVRSAALLPAGWALVMMGWGPLKEELQHIARDEVHAGKVLFHPGVPREELHLWSAGASVGIIPYENVVMNHWICSPNKLWEFPTAGVPIIVQPYPELRDVVENYSCGWILPEAFTPQAIATLIGSLSDEDLARAREGCLRFIEADNWEAVYEKRLVAFYNSLETRVAATGAARELQYGYPA